MSSLFSVAQPIRNGIRHTITNRLAEPPMPKHERLSRECEAIAHWIETLSTEMPVGSLVNFDLSMARDRMQEAARVIGKTR